MIVAIIVSSIVLWLLSVVAITTFMMAAGFLNDKYDGVDDAKNEDYSEGE